MMALFDALSDKKFAGKLAGELEIAAVMEEMVGGGSFDSWALNWLFLGGCGEG
jgi:hypothetical protein